MIELPDSVLFDFDPAECADWDPNRVASLLEEEPVYYRHQLALGRAFANWAEMMERNSLIDLRNPFYNGFREALLWATARLRQGDFLPGGQTVHLFDPESSPDIANLIEEWKKEIYGEGE